MKKMMLVVCAALAGAAFANPVTNGLTRLDAKTATEADFRAAYNAVMTTTNREDFCAVISATALYGLRNRDDLAALRAEVDEGLASKGYANVPGIGIIYCHQFPKTTAAVRRLWGLDGVYARSTALAEKYRCPMTPWGLFISGASLDDIVTMLGEMCVCPTNGTYVLREFERGKQAIQKLAVKAVKRKLREQGKSFVTKDGVNPCEKYMTALNTALNAPRFTGLNDWLADLGFEARIDESKMPTEAEVTALRDAVFYGEREMRNRNTAILYICLGVEGYNAFVKEYNGEK